MPPHQLSLVQHDVTDIFQETNFEGPLSHHEDTYVFIILQIS